MDYQKLLEKYMAWVGEQEGVYFIPTTPEFTAEEVDALKAASEIADTIRF